MITVLLADDEAMVRAGVRAILAAAPDIEVVAEAVNGREACELARAHRPDVALLDIRMPVLDGLGAAARDAAGQLRESAARASDRLREIIGVLRQDSEPAPLLPSTTPSPA